MGSEFTQAICPKELFEQIEGDLIEIYNYDVKTVGEQKAKLKFIITAVRFFRPGIIFRNRFQFGINQTFMIGNYFKVASRNILKRKMYSFINAFGLSIGIAFCILIYLFIRDERSFDQFHSNKNQIYRMEAKRNSTNPSRRDASLQLGLRNALKDEVPR